MSRLLQLYNRPSTVFTHGLKAKLFDSLGREYLDFNAGIAVNALGHGDKEIASIIADQSSKLIHLSNLYHNEYAGKLADKLVESLESAGKWTGQQVFFCNSGTEANEAALKFARKYSHDHKGKYGVVSFGNAFHGRTFGALSATHTKKYQEPFMPLVPGFKVAKFNSLDLDAITSDTCAVLVEPIQGEGGIHLASAEFLRAVRQKCDEVGALLIFDEIQCGLGRTGKLHAYTNFGVVPDILTLAKPIGAVLVSERVAKTLKAGDHGTTFGGSPLCTRVGLAVLNRISQPSLLEHVQKMGALLRKRAESMSIVEFRGKGLIAGIELPASIDTAKFTAKCLEKQLLVVAAGSQTIRLIPPLVISKDEINKGMDIIDSVIKSF